MSQTYDVLNDKLIAFIQSQKIFFVATSPRADDGHVNVSPKGYDSFRILGPKQVAYCDLGGSGAETMAHVRENGRITLMFCAFEGVANIVRLYGQGRVMQFDEPGFAEELALFPGVARARNIITVDVERISDSCGWAVPFFEFKGERNQLRKHVDHRTHEDWAVARYAANAQSIDGLSALMKSQ